MESISRIGSLLENARDLTLEAAKDVGPRRTPRALPAQQIKKLLDSPHEREVLDGLRRVVAMQYGNPPQPTLTFFPAVLKTLSKQSASTRPLVYNYLVHHAEADPDTALLAINTVQKTLSDSNPRVRASALKTIAGIRVPVISQIISLAIKKGVSDLSPIVRKTAALACVKCVKLDPTTRPQVEDYLKTLLADQQYYVTGAAVQAFMQICPERLDMIHPIYRKLCKMVVDMDEWGQLATLRLMVNYARQCFPQRTTPATETRLTSKQEDTFYDEQPAEDQLKNLDGNTIDPDLDTLLRAARQLLQNRSSSVIIAVTRLFRYLSPDEYLPHAVGPLIGLLRSPQDLREVALYNIVQVCLCNPALFCKHIRHFFIKATEPPSIRRLRLEVLTLTFPHLDMTMQSLVLVEMEHFSGSHDEELVRESVRAIGRCAQASDPNTSRKCLSLLLKQIHAEDAHLVGEAVEVVRHLIQRDPDSHRKTVIRLAKNLDTISSATARANVVWLVGEFSGHDVQQNIAADVLRILVKDFANESDEVKQQIVLLAAKVYLHHLNAKNAKQSESSSTENADDQPLSSEEEPIEKLYQYVQTLARYSQSYDLRDRVRTYHALLASNSSTELATLILLAPKPVPQAPSPSEANRNLVLGSGSLVIGHAASIGLREQESVPEWVEAGQEPDASLRDVGDAKADGDARQVVSAGQRLDEALNADSKYRSEVGTKKEKTLDAWLDEEDESEDEDGDDEENEEDDDEDDSQDEEESSEYETETGSEEETGDDEDENAKLVA